jgi:hypothetical protein
MIEVNRHLKCGKIGKAIFSPCVNGSKNDLLIGAGRDGALRKDAQRKVDRDCARMKEIQRPDVHGAARQVDATGRGRCDSFCHEVSY